MIGTLLHARSPAHHLDAVDAGQAEVEDDDVGPSTAGGRVERCRGRPAGVDVVARARRLIASPRIAGLVVDDQHASHVSRAEPWPSRPPAGHGHGQPAAGGLGTDQGAAHRLGEAARDRQPQADAFAGR